MQLDDATVDKIEALSQMLDKPPLAALNDALDFYLNKVRDDLLEADLAEQRKATNLSYDEFWDGVDL